MARPSSNGMSGRTLFSSAFGTPPSLCSPSSQAAVTTCSSASNTRSSERRPDLVRVFLLGELAAQECPPIRRQILEHAASELNKLEPLRDSLELGESDTDFNGRAALEFGLRDAAVEEQWANWQVAAIDERAQK